MKQLAIVFGPALLLAAACSSTPLTPAPIVSQPQTSPTTSHSDATPIPSSKPVALVNAQSPMATFEHLQSSLDRDSIYFDYNQSAIRSVADSLIARHAKALQTYSRDDLTLQGNCDERGSSEYNLALGQRRADAVKERLVLMGVPAARIDTVSFGKEKPRETCHQEKCWAENRRADFVDSWK